MIANYQFLIQIAVCGCSWGAHAIDSSHGSRKEIHTTTSSGVYGRSLKLYGLNVIENAYFIVTYVPGSDAAMESRMRLFSPMFPNEKEKMLKWLCRKIQSQHHSEIEVFTSN